jgi:hypothetical protein
MQEKGSEFLGEAQQANQATFEAIQGLAETHFKLLQKLADFQRQQFNRALEAARDQLRLVTQAKDPRAWADAQANLVQSYGQRYIERANEAAGLMSTAWQEYQDQFQKAMSAVAGTVRDSADTARRGTQTKGAASKKST